MSHKHREERKEKHRGKEQIEEDCADAKTCKNVAKLLQYHLLCSVANGHKYTEEVKESQRMLTNYISTNYSPSMAQKLDGYLTQYNTGINQLANGGRGVAAGLGAGISQIGSTIGAFFNSLFGTGNFPERMETYSRSISQTLQNPRNLGNHYKCIIDIGYCWC